MLAVLVISVCFLAFANGANDNFKGVASLYGSRTTSYRKALLWATITTLAGSLCALYFAQTLLIRFSGKGLVLDSLVQSVPFVLAVASGAGLTVMLATRLGFPVSTTHALLGAMIGTGLLASRGEINLLVLKQHFVLPLLLSPVVAVLLVVLVYLTLRQLRKHTHLDQPLCVCIENETVITRQGDSVAMTVSDQPVYSLETEQACTKRNSNKVLGLNSKNMLDTVHFASAGAVCFARGLNDTPKIAALLLLVPMLDLQWVIGLVAATMAMGGVLKARHVAETMSHRITEMSDGQGLAANISTAFLVIVASQLGMPVSTTHVSVGTLFGIGIINGKTHQRMIGTVVSSWLLTLPCAAFCAAIIYSLSGSIVFETLLP